MKENHCRITDLKKYLNENGLEPLLTTKRYFNIKDIRAFLPARFTALKPETLNRYLVVLLKNGVLHSAGKGWYSSIKDRFVLDTKPVRKTITLLEKIYPLLDFQCWSTAQINAYTHHLLVKHITFVCTEADAINPVAETLRAEGYTVFANPTQAEAKKTFRMDNKTVVIRPSVSKQPYSIAHAAPIEKILVDLVVEASDIKFMDESEAHLIVENVTSAGRVMMASLLGYAKRRLVDLSGLKTINQVQINNKIGDS